LRLLAAGIIVALLSGCAINPVSEALTRAINLNGATLKGAYKQANLVGVVLVDEDYVGRYQRIIRGTLHMQGARAGSPEMRYRVVSIGIRESDLIRHTFLTGAIVPDSLPLLVAGDIVEFRNQTGFDNFRDFSRTKEGGGIVLRVICFKDDPRFEECTKTRAPWKGYLWRKEVSGLSDTPYRESTASYGFTFSERFDDEGEVLPGAPELPRRPHSSTSTAAR